MRSQIFFLFHFVGYSEFASLKALLGQIFHLAKSCIDREMVVGGFAKAKLSFSTVGLW